MKVKNKKTGEIREIKEILIDGMFNVNSLAELNEEWEESKELSYWYIDNNGDILFSDLDGDQLWEDLAEERKAIGNYFEAKEEAEKAVKKLTAWKRLKDKGFRFEGIKEDYTRILQSQEPFRTGKRYLQFNKSEDEDWMKENWDALDLLFGGEE